MKIVAACLLAGLSFSLVACGGGGGGGSESDELHVGNSGLAITAFNGNVVSVGGWAALLVSESAQNNRDLSGDLDAGDQVVHLFDPATGVAVNTALTAREPVVPGDTIVAWKVWELDQNSDLNLDGDFLDVVIAVMDTTLPAVPGTNPLIIPTAAGASTVLGVEGNVVVLAVSETDLGADANGDGDMMDAVIRFCAAPAFAPVTPLFAVAGAFALENGHAAFQADEAGSGMTDLNLDGDMGDIVLFMRNLATGVMTAVGPGGATPRAAAPIFAIGGTNADPVLVYAIDEAAEGGTNFNMALTGDTDMTDFVLATFRVSTATESVRGVAVVPTSIVATESRAAAIADEGQNGTPGRDYNGDSDTADSVPHWVDLLATVPAWNTAVAGSGELRLCENYLVFKAVESAQGTMGTNFNSSTGDTDTSDEVAFFVDLTTPGTPGVSLELAVDDALCLPGAGAFFVTASEPNNNGIDLNADGDTSDIVVVYFRVATGFAIRGSDPINSDGPLAFQVCPSHIRIFGNASESNGFGDMNEDGDTDDFAIAATRIRRDNGGVVSFRPIGTSDFDGSAFPIVLDSDTIAFPYSEMRFRTGLNANPGSGDTDSADLVFFFVNTACE